MRLYSDAAGMVVRGSLCLLGTAALFALFFLPGCDSGGGDPAKKEDPVVASNFPFSAMAPFLTVAPETVNSVELWGGSAPYAVQSISDSTKIYAAAAGITVHSGKYFLEVRGKTKGITSIVVKDAGGKTPIPIEVRVQAFTGAPAAAALSPSEAVEVRLRSGNRPYAIAQQPKSQVVTAELTDTVLFLYAVGNGSTSVVLRDQNGAGDNISIPIVVTNVLKRTGAGGTIVAGGTVSDSIVGGVPPYILYSYDDKVTASISGSMLTVTANASASGAATVTVADNSVPRRLLNVPVSIVTSLSLTPASLSIASGASVAVSIAGGTLPYAISSQPDGSTASASITGSTLAVTGIGAGMTAVTVRDASNPVQSQILPITVTSNDGFTTAGSLSFTYASGSGQSTPFAANGVFNNIRAGSTAAGGFSYPGSPSKIVIYAYKTFSQVSADIVSLTLTNTGAIMAGDYPLASTAAKNAAGFYKINANLNDTSRMGYMFSSGTLTVTSYNGMTITGTFSGGAYDILNNLTTISITGGQFSVPVISGTGRSIMDQKIRKMIVRSLR